MTEPFKINEAQSCIVIHPGSKYLRIGKPSDSSPQTMLHAIAYRRINSGINYRDTFLPPTSLLDKALSNELEDCRLKASHLLQLSLMSDGTRRFATPSQQIAVFNKRCEAEINESYKPSPDWENMMSSPIIGDKILSLNPKLPYNIHFPYKRGEFNLHKGPGGTISSVISHLQHIWSYAISDILNIPIKDLPNFKAVLVIPTIYDRSHVKMLTNLLLSSLNFGSCFVVQEHIAATFGAGLSAACVVDIGDQKTSISCVEDAVSHPATRIRMDYGGSDITQLFHWLLKKCSFPYRFNPGNKFDVSLLTQLKQEFCHLNLDLCGAYEKSFTVRLPNKVPETYNIQVGDEVLLAPLSLFFPELLKITGAKTNSYQKPNTGDPEDPLDECFLRETRRMRGREATESLDITGDGEGDEEILEDQNSLIAKTESDKLLSLDQAILASIERCSNEDLKKKMYSCILIVGGGGKFDNLSKWIQDRINVKIPIHLRPDQIEVITKPKDLDPQLTIWKGASLLTCLDGSSELWISKQDWIRFGVKILREKCPFIW